MGDSLKASTQGLEIIDRIRKQKGWSRQASIWYQSALTSQATLKRFLQGEAIQRETFVRICQAVGLERWEEIVDRTILPVYLCPIKYWHGVPDISAFYGRTEELANLEQWIGDRCRLVALLGMGGIGKTALAVKLAEQIQSQFDYLIWYSLRHAPPLEKVLIDWLDFLHKNSNSEPPQNSQNIQNISDRISELMSFCRSHRCLLILDNLETILCSGDYAGYYREKYKSYGDLIKRMGEEQHQSCLIVTSREKTREIALLEGKDQPVRSLKLEGLKEAARGILKAKDLSEESQWGTLIQIYRGNPLVLKMVATTIKEIFDGKVAAFLKQKITLVTGDIDSFIAQQFNRLSDLEKDILYQLAKQKDPVLLSQFQEILSLSPPELFRAIESLMRRSLIEKSATGFTLQPVVMEYVTNLLEQKPDED